MPPGASSAGAVSHEPLLIERGEARRSPSPRALSATRRAAEGLAFSLCQHDWSSIRADPQMRATETLIRYAQEQGLRFMSYRSYYEACKDSREAAASAMSPATAHPSRRP